MTQLPVTGSVRVGGYALEVGTETGSFAQFEREREKEHARELGDALVEKPDEPLTLVDAVVEVEDTADAVTDRVEHANKLFRAGAEGGLLERDLLTGEIGALLGLLQRLDKAGRFDEELRLARALHGLLVLAFRWYELIRSLRMVLGAARAAHHEAGQAWALNELGSLHLCAGDAKRAVGHLEEALALEERLGNAAGRCAARHNLDSARRDLALGGSGGRPTRFRRVAVVAAAIAVFGTGAAFGFVVRGDDGSTPQRVTLVVDKGGEGEGTVAGADGAIDCGGDCSEELEAGTPVTLTAKADPGSRFGGWENVDCGAAESCLVALDGDRTVGAVFDLVPPGRRTLSVDFRGSGSGSVSLDGIECSGDCNGTFTAGSAVTLTAEADGGSDFVRWEDVDCEQEEQEEASCTVTLDDDVTLGAVFEQESAALAVDFGGKGSGSVSGGIDCPGACKGTFATGSPVTLTALAGEGSVFVRWEGVDCESGDQEAEVCTVTVGAEMTAVAVFEPGVALTVRTGGGGTITSDPTRIDCRETCSAEFAQDSEVTLTPVPDDGWEFAGWGGEADCPGTGDCKVVLTEPKVVQAKFRAAQG